MDDDRHELVNQAGNSLSREQKAGFLFVIVIGVGALLLGGQYMWTHMAKPFTINYTGPRFMTGAEAELAQMAEQKQLDTDTDGINDYDELYIYKTSPYLNDSDSDGQADGSEINAGQDPNCAPGAECSLAVNEDVSLLGGTADLADEAAALDAQEQALMAALDELANLPVEDIRGLLLESGADPATVAELSDEEVKVLYQEILLQLEESGELDNILNSASGSSQLPGT